MDTLYYVILVPMVYAAFAVFLLGTVVRLVFPFTRPKEGVTPIFPKKPAAWAGALYDSFLMPSVRRHKPVLWVFLIVFHFCLLLLFLGHLELIAEMNFLQVIPHEVFLGHGYVGLILAICVLFFLFRRFFSPVRDISVPEDYLLLVLLFLVIIFGAEMDWARTWFYYEGMTVDNYREYLFSLIQLHPELPYEVTASGHSFMLVLHVFFANLFLMLMPFSKIMHAFLALPVNKLRRG